MSQLWLDIDHYCQFMGALIIHSCFNDVPSLDTEVLFLFTDKKKKEIWAASYCLKQTWSSFFPYKCNRVLSYSFLGGSEETSGGSSVTLIRDAGSPSINSRAHWQKTAPTDEASSHDSWKYVAERARTVLYFDNRRFGGAGKHFCLCLLDKYLPLRLVWSSSFRALAS